MILIDGKKIQEEMIIELQEEASKKMAELQDDIKNLEKLEQDNNV